MHNFREMVIWKRSLELSKLIYKHVSQFPTSEVYGLASQIKRSAVSIPSNIAEGSSRSSDKDFNRFLQIALGSAFELETQLILAREFDYLTNQNYTEILKELNEIQKMINGFRTKLKA